MDGTLISFDGNSLQTTNILTQQINHESNPVKNATIYPLAHANRSAIPFISYPGKQITITGELWANDNITLDALVDQFKFFFINQDRNLDIGYRGSTRRYIATGDVSIDRPGGIGHANFTVTFNCTQPFGRDITQTIGLVSVGRSNATYNDPITFAGNAPYQLPVFTATYTAITGGTNKSVVFGNNANGQSITVTANWNVGDVLQIDVANKLVTINGIMKDFSGAFPEFPPGAQSVAYSDGFTTRTFNYNLAYFAMWL